MSNLLTLPEREALVSQIDLQDALNQRVKINPLKYFLPTGKQEEFISKIGTGNIFIGVFSGANRAGKTTLSANISGSIIYGVQSSWFKHPLFLDWQYPKRARIGSNPKNLEEIGAITQGIEDWWPAGRYTTSKGGKHYDSLYRSDTGWVIDVMSYEQDPKEWESVSLGLVIFDEPPPQSIFRATVARMEHGGIILIFMTPLSDAGYIFDEIIDKKEGLKPSHRIAVTYTDIEDSCKEHGVRGFLDHKYIEQMVSQYDTEEIEARAHGRPMHLSGRIYKGFNESVHIVDDFPTPEDWPRANIVDPHDAHPFAISWVAVNNFNDYYVYDEYPTDPFESIKSNTLTFKDYATIIRNKEGKRIISRRLMDPNFGRKVYGNTKRTVADEMGDFGLVYDTTVNDSLDIGHSAVRERLQYDLSQVITSINKPKLFIFRSCRNHWVSMMRYQYKHNPYGAITDKVGIEETYKHFCDNIRYLCVSGFDYQVIRYNYQGEGDYKRKKVKTRSAMSA